MNLTEAEDIALQYFRGQSFGIEEWPFLDASIEWRPRARVTRLRLGVPTTAAIVIRETCASYKEPFNWEPLLETRRTLPNLAIYFIVPEAHVMDPLLSELHELGIGLYAIRPDGTLHKICQDRVPFDDTVISYPIEPAKPYRNRQTVLKMLSRCRNHIWWLDKHFTADGLSFLHEYVTQWDTRPALTQVLILGSAIVGDADLVHLKTNLKALAIEVRPLGVSVEMRLITDNSILGSIHDRYVISDGTAFNVLPTRSLVRGQTGSLTLEENPPDFLALWKHATPL